MRISVSNLGPVYARLGILIQYVRELVNNSPYGFEADLWSLGGLMVTCLSGKPAFEVRLYLFMSVMR